MLYNPIITKQFCTLIFVELGLQNSGRIVKDPPFTASKRVRVLMKRHLSEILSEGRCDIPTYSQKHPAPFFLDYHRK